MSEPSHFPLPWFHEPAARGSTCVIRYKAPHYTGQGDIIAKSLRLEDAIFVCDAVNSHHRLLDALEELADAARSATDARQHTALIDALSKADEMIGKLRARR